MTKLDPMLVMPKITIEYKSFREDDAEKWQADAIFPDGRNYHAIASTPFEALRRLASFWEGRHERDTLPSKRPRRCVYEGVDLSEGKNTK